MPTATFFNLDPGKQKKITDAATDIFVQHGYDLTTIQQIIREAGIPRGSFYQYFTDKTDLYFHIFKILGEQKISYMEPLMRQYETLGIFEFLEQALPLGIQFAKDNPKAVSITYDYLNAKTLDKTNMMDQLMKDIEVLNMNVVDMLSVPIENSKKNGEITTEISTENLIHYIKNLFQGAAELAVSKKQEIDIKAYKEAINLLKNGLVQPCREHRKGE